MAIEPFAWSQPQPRIVQHKGRRYALRLEPIFWRQLERVARRRGRRLGYLVAELDEAYEGVNLSSFIRGYCMIEAEKEATHFRLAAGSFDLLDVLKGAPAPALLLSEDRIVLEVNQALLDWIGGGTVIRQNKFDEFFEPRVLRPLDETIDLMRTGKLKRTQIQVVYQGRVVMATLTGLLVGSIFYCLVWLTVTNQSRATISVG